MEGGSRIRELAPVALAAVTADVGARLLTPRGHRRPAAPADPADYFSPKEIRRGARYERPQRWLGIGRLVVETGVLLALVQHARRSGEQHAAAAAAAERPPAPPAAQTPAAPLEALGEQLDPHEEPEPAEHPALLRRESTPRAAAEGAVVGAWLALATSLAPLPLRALSRHRARKVGLVTQTWRGWTEDLVKSAAIESVFSAAGGAGIVALTRVSPQGWWKPAAAASVGLGTGLAALAPVLLDPLFNDYEPLAPGPVRDDVLALAKAARVKVGEVYSVDASRRTTAANAYVTGLGPSKRVVLFDTLLDRYTRDEVRVVVAHELGHVRHRDVPRSVAYAAIVAGPTMLAVQRLSWLLEPRQVGEPAALPALALATGLVTFPLGLIGSRMSRAVERRADAFSLALTGAVDAFVSFERKICLQNVADVRAPGWFSRVAASHPPTMERIAAAVAHPQR